MSYLVIIGGRKRVESLEKTRSLMEELQLKETWTDLQIRR